ncbi:MAG: aminoacyl-tRNA hydrolase [Bryobacteraceae bacterium]
MDAATAPWLVVGLGNPGSEYEWTPHNLGFLTVDRLAVSNKIRVDRKDSKALFGVGNFGGKELLLAKPQTFMNVSGPSVLALMEKHGVPASNLVVVYDELDLPWTAVRVRPKGSAAGHNGVDSVIRSIGTMEFPRVRLGINPGHKVGSGARFVLGQFKKAQMQELDELLDHAARAVESIIAEGVEKSMTKFNRRAQGLNKEEE